LKVEGVCKLNILSRIIRPHLNKVYMEGCGHERVEKEKRDKVIHFIENKYKQKVKMGDVVIPCHTHLCIMLLLEFIFIFIWNAQFYPKGLMAYNYTKIYIQSRQKTIMLLHVNGRFTMEKLK